jgi:hypothetical protein
MKKAIVAAIAVVFFVSTAAEARGGRGFSGGRSFSRPAPARTYAPNRTTVVKKNTTVVNQTVHQNTTSSGGGFWSTVMGAAAGSMAGNAIYDVMTKDDEPKQPAQAPQQPQVIYVPVGSDGKPVQQNQ